MPTEKKENERSSSSYFRAIILQLGGTIYSNMNALWMNNTVKELAVSCVEALNLRGTQTQHFTNFKRRRELYERLLEKERDALGRGKGANFYRASIENEELEVFIAAA